MKPRRITERDCIRNQIKHSREWLAGYAENGAGTPEARVRAKAVAAMNTETATVADLLTVGQSCTVHCNGCGKWVHEAVEVGDESDYESATATLCRACLDEAVESMNGSLKAAGAE